jgi:hypothetical protein
MGIPIKVPKSRAVKLTWRDTKTMPITPPSKWASKLKASEKAVNMRSILSRQWQNASIKTNIPIF